MSMNGAVCRALAIGECDRHEWAALLAATAYLPTAVIVIIEEQEAGA